jgi:hypothetical protein
MRTGKGCNAFAYTGVRVVEFSAPVQIECGLRGEGLPPVPDRRLQVTGRLGIDLRPVDARDLASRLWLENSQKVKGDLGGDT